MNVPDRIKFEQLFLSELQFLLLTRKEVFTKGNETEVVEIQQDPATQHIAFSTIDFHRSSDDTYLIILFRSRHWDQFGWALPIWAAMVDWDDGTEPPLHEVPDVAAELCAIEFRQDLSNMVLARHSEPIQWLPNRDLPMEE